MFGMGKKTKDCPPSPRASSEWLDAATPDPRLGFHTRTELPPNLEETPEGYLIARNVALARTGQQLYMDYEVPLEPGPDGTIVVERPESEVFRPETIASFNGKPFTDSHPFEDVAAHNWRHHMVGTVMNPRRGEGDRSHCLIGDIIVYDPKVIQKIKNGVREVSAGYDANYERIEAGRGAQRDILANHVSLVPEGRCGPTCAILDQKVTPMAKQDKKGFLDGLRAAFKARDEDAFEEVMKTAQEEGIDKTDEPERPDTEEKESGGSSAQTHNVTVNIGGMTPDSVAAMRKNQPARDEEPDAGEGAPQSPQEMIAAAVSSAIAPLMERVQSIETALQGMSDEMDDVRDPDDTVTTDAIARAEILKPGVKLPTFDAKPGSVKQRDAVVAFQRTVLAEAFNTKDGRAAIAPLVSSARPNFSTMAAGEVNVVFRAASERMRDAANARISTVLPTRIVDGERKTFDNKAWNDKNKSFWNRA